MQALVDWCSGFISGLGLSGQLTDDSMDTTVKEILEDFMEMTRMDIDVTAGEEHEMAFTEIEEYVRAGVMTIGLTLRRKQDPTLH